MTLRFVLIKILMCAALIFFKNSPLYELHSATIGSTNNHQLEVACALSDNSAAQVDIFNCAPGGYLLTFTGFDETIQIKYVIYEVESNVVVDQDKLVLTNNNRYLTPSGLDDCTVYRVVASGKNYPRGEIVTATLSSWCPGFPIC